MHGLETINRMNSEAALRAWVGGTPLAPDNVNVFTVIWDEMYPGTNDVKRTHCTEIVTRVRTDSPIFADHCLRMAGIAEGTIVTGEVATDDMELSYVLAGGPITLVDNGG